ARRRQFGARPGDGRFRAMAPAARRDPRARRRDRAAIPHRPHAHRAPARRSLARSLGDRLRRFRRVPRRRRRARGARGRRGAHAPTASTPPAPTASAEPPKPAPPAPAARYTGAFATPECALYDDANDRYLVSNINGKPTDADGNGYISELSPDGTVKTPKWIA